MTFNFLVFYNIVSVLQCPLNGSKIWIAEPFFKNMSQIGFFVKSTEDIGYNYMSLTSIIHEDVHSIERRSFLWDCVWFFWEDTCTYLSVYFFIWVYIDSTACVDLVYFCLFDMKNYLMACMKPTLHICNIHQCTIENNVCVYSCNPPGLPPSWQLSVWEKAFAGDVMFLKCCTLYAR